MSNISTSEKIYIREFDSYHSISDDDELEWFAEEKEGDIQLLGGVAVSSSMLHKFFFMSSEDWHWAQYRAGRRFSQGNQWRAHERTLAKELLALGRVYAIRRYARREGIAADAALAAAMPYGMTALLYRFFTEEGIALGSEQRDKLKLLFGDQWSRCDANAYERTGLLQAAIYEIAAELEGPLRPGQLGRIRMRNILSASRLHFSLMELRGLGFEGVGSLERKYELARQHPIRPVIVRADARYRRAWAMQHLWPLSYYYPIPLRQALARGIRQTERSSRWLDRAVFVNELALAYCVMQASGERRSARCTEVPVRAVRA